MGERDERLREALLKIAELASAAANGDDVPEPDDDDDDDGVGAEESEATPGCSLKNVPKRLLVKAAQNAIRINPVNAPMLAASALGAGMPSTPQAIAVLVGKYWGPKPRRLTVSFMDSPSSSLRARIVKHLNAWTKTGGISFAETGDTGQVRIARGPGGYWSYLGTDVMLIPKNLPTMNLQGFTMNTPESEYRRVVRHEAGHTLGFPHEHMRKALIARIDKTKAYAYFLATQGWDKTQVDQQVLTPLEEANLIPGPIDETSIMCYQLPGSITKDGKPIRGGPDINQTDYAFVGTIYPRPGHSHSFAAADDWDETEDVSEAAE